MAVFTDTQNLWHILETGAISVAERLMKNAMLTGPEAGKVIVQLVAQMIQSSVDGALRMRTVELEQQIKEVELYSAFYQLQVKQKELELMVEKGAYEIDNIVANTAHVKSQTSIGEQQNEQMLAKLSKEITLIGVQGLTALGEMQIAHTNALHAESKLKEDINLIKAQTSATKAQELNGFKDLELKEFQSVHLQAQTRTEESQQYKLAVESYITQSSLTEVVARGHLVETQIETERVNQLTALKQGAHLTAQTVTEAQNTELIRSKVITEGTAQLQTVAQAKVLVEQAKLVDKQATTEVQNTALTSAKVVTEGTAQLQAITQSKVLTEQARLVDKQATTEVQNTELTKAKVVTEGFVKLQTENQAKVLAEQAKLVINQTTTEVQNAELTKAKVVTEGTAQLQAVSQSKVLAEQAKLVINQTTTEVQNTELTKAKVITEGTAQLQAVNQSKVLAEQAKLVDKQAATEIQNTELTKAKVVTEGFVKSQTDNQAKVLAEQAKLVTSQTVTEVQNTALITAKVVTEGTAQLQAVSQSKVLSEQAKLVDKQATTEVQNTALITAKVVTEGTAQLQAVAQSKVLAEQAKLVDKQATTEVQNTALITAKVATEGTAQLQAVAQSSVLTEQAKLVDKQATTEVQNTALITAKVATEGTAQLQALNQAKVLGAQAELVTNQTTTETQNTALIKAKVITEGTAQLQAVAQSKVLDAQSELVTKQTDTEVKNTALITAKTATETEVKLQTTNQAAVLSEQAKLVAKQTDTEAQNTLLVQAKAATEKEVKTQTTNQATVLSEQAKLVAKQTDTEAQNTSLVQAKVATEFGNIKFADANTSKTKAEKLLVDENITLTKTKVAEGAITNQSLQAKMEVELGYKYTDLGVIKLSDPMSSLTGANLLKIKAEIENLDAVVEAKKGELVAQLLQTATLVSKASIESGLTLVDNSAATGEMVDSKTGRVNLVQVGQMLKASLNNTDNARMSLMAYQRDSAAAQIIGYDKATKLKSVELFKDLIGSAMMYDKPIPIWAVSALLRITEDLSVPSLPKPSDDTSTASTDPLGYGVLKRYGSSYRDSYKFYNFSPDSTSRDVAEGITEEYGISGIPSAFIDESGLPVDNLALFSIPVNEFANGASYDSSKCADGESSIYYLAISDKASDVRAELKGKYVRFGTPYKTAATGSPEVLNSKPMVYNDLQCTVLTPDKVTGDVVYYIINNNRDKLGDGAIRLKLDNTFKYKT